ncbi:hypothetical protein Leryth_003361 [Lithospermum erythrorhizon]|nr:hypothetical protein Leryth_003361 [Lithospermum erythrorhizon]
MRKVLLQTDELREKLKQKTNEVNVGKEVQLNLENIIRSKDLMLIDKDRMLKELKETSGMIESRDSERKQNEQLLRKYEKENRLLLELRMEEKYKNITQQMESVQIRSAKEPGRSRRPRPRNRTITIDLKQGISNIMLTGFQKMQSERSNESDEGMASHEK